MIDILVVEDDIKDLQRCVKLLEKGKYSIRIHQVTSGNEAYNVR